MIKLLAILMLLSGSVPVSLLEELAIKSRTLAPIVEVADLYFSAGILDYLPLRIPVVGGRVSSPYGYRKDPLTGKGRFHAGLDYACELATTVHASAAGVVCFVGHRGGYGKCVEVKHRYGFSSIYAHLSGYYVRTGESIRVSSTL